MSMINIGFLISLQPIKNYLKIEKYVTSYISSDSVLQCTLQFSASVSTEAVPRRFR